MAGKKKSFKIWPAADKHHVSHWSPLQPCQLFLSTELPSQDTAVAAASGDRDWLDMCERALARWLLGLTSHSIPHTACCWWIPAVLILPCDNGCTLGNVSLTWRVTQEPAFVIAMDFISRKQTNPLKDSCKRSRFAIKCPHDCCFTVLEPRQQRQRDLFASHCEKKADPLLCFMHLNHISSMVGKNMQWSWGLSIFTENTFCTWSSVMRVTLQTT